MKSGCSLRISNYSIFICLLIFFICVNYTHAESPRITDFKLNGKSENVTFNPNNGEEVSIEVKANKPVKFTRIYICSTTQSCTGSSGNYTRYFTSNDISESILKSWNGKVSSASNAGFAPAGEYKIKVSMAEDGQETISEFGQSSIFLDFTTQTMQPPGGEDDNGDSIDIEVENISSSYGLNTGDISTHSSTEDLSNYKDGSNVLKVSAGRERLTYTGFFVEFTAKSNLNSDAGLNYSWSFGDGKEQGGQKVTHIYKNVGEYVVILNAFNGEDEAISRTTVRVLEPNLYLERLENEDYILKNNGKFEINIGNLKLQKGFEIFSIAKDTIIPAGKSLIFSDIFREKGNGAVVLKTFSGLEIAKINTESTDMAKMSNHLGLATSSEIIVINERELNSFLSEFKKINENKTKVVSHSPQTINAFVPQIANISDVFEKLEDTVVTSTQVLSDIEKIESNSKSLWQRIISAPVSLFRNIKDSFYEIE